MHIYTKNNKDYPSVTTILKALGNAGLLSWSNYLGFKHISYEKELDKYAKFGTLVHSHLEHIVNPDSKNEIIKPDNQLDEYVLDTILRRFTNYISLFDYKTIYSEYTLISESLGYAGTLDWVLEINNKRILCDFKTSKATRISMMLQLGGYYNLLRDMGEDVDYAAILIVNENRCKFNFVDKVDLIEYAKYFDLIAKFYLESEWHKEPKPKINTKVEKELMKKL